MDDDVDCLSSHFTADDDGADIRKRSGPAAAPKDDCLMTPPTDIEIEGRACELANAEWRERKHRVSLAQCDAVARRFTLGLTGEQVVERILDYVRAQSGTPVWGKQIVDTFKADIEGAANLSWTTFFKYACNERGLLRYKRKPVSQASRVYFVLSGDAALMR